MVPSLAWAVVRGQDVAAGSCFDPGRRLGVAALANSAGALPSPLDQAVLGAFG